VGRKDVVDEKRLEGLYSPATSKITSLNQSILKRMKMPNAAK